MSSEAITNGRADSRPKAPWPLSQLGPALKRPKDVTQVLRAKWQLRGCTSSGMTVRLEGRVFVQNYGRIDVGERVRISGRTVPVELVSWPGGRLTVGEGTFLNYGVSLSAHEELSIGKDCLFGTYVCVMDGDYHDLIDHTLPGKSAPIVIEDRVWLGIRSVVLKGVRIGHDSVIGAGSVVTKDIPPHSLAFGSPARVVKTLSGSKCPEEREELAHAAGLQAVSRTA